MAFTIQSIWNELRDREFSSEIIAVYNWSDVEMRKQSRIEDQGWEFLTDRVNGKYVVDLEWLEPGTPPPAAEGKAFQYLNEIKKIRPELKVLHYDKKLSHWQAKNMGVENSSGKILWFCDSHCIIHRDTVSNLYRRYVADYDRLNGTLHLPLSYMLDAAGRELIYKLSGEIERGEVHYSFTRYRPAEEPYAVPCMSTCGMMMSREIYDELGGWPEELGIYGGGENFINFTLAVLGRKVNIFPSLPLWHYAEKRGYNWNYDDYVRNRMIATYMFAGDELARLYAKCCKGNPLALRRILETVVYNREIKEQRRQIESRQKVEIHEWLKEWKGKEA